MMLECDKHLDKIMPRATKTTSKDGVDDYSYHISGYFTENYRESMFEEIILRLDLKIIQEPAMGKS